MNILGKPQGKLYHHQYPISEEIRWYLAPPTIWGPAKILKTKLGTMRNFNAPMCKAAVPHSLILP